MVNSLPRSPEIMRPDDTGLLVIDLQGRLLLAQPTPEHLEWNVRRLIDGATALGVQIAVTEQSPEKLGPTSQPIATALQLPEQSSVGSERALENDKGVSGEDQVLPTEKLEDSNTGTPREGVQEPRQVHVKNTFSCGDCGDLFAHWRTLGIHRVLLCGIETHVCVQQTALDLLAAGYQVQVVVDAVSSRMAINHEIGLRRLELSGAILTTVEGALFELCGRAGTVPFKKISALAKEKGPE